MRGEGVQGPPRSPAYTFLGGVPEMFSPYPYAKGNVDTAPATMAGAGGAYIALFFFSEGGGGKMTKWGNIQKFCKKRGRGGALCRFYLQRVDKEKRDDTL